MFNKELSEHYQHGEEIILSISINSLRKNRGLCNSTAQLLQAYIYHVQTGLLFLCKTSA